MPGAYGVGTESGCRPRPGANRDLTADPAALLAVLRAGAETVGPIASGTVSRARQAMGLLG